MRGRLRKKRNDAVSTHPIDTSSSPRALRTPLLPRASLDVRPHVSPGHPGGTCRRICCRHGRPRVDGRNVRGGWPRPRARARLHQGARPQQQREFFVRVRVCVCVCVWPVACGTAPQTCFPFPPTLPSPTTVQQSPARSVPHRSLRQPGPRLAAGGCVHAARDRAGGGGQGGRRTAGARRVQAVHAVGHGEAGARVLMLFSVVCRERERERQQSVSFV